MSQKFSFKIDAKNNKIKLTYGDEQCFEERLNFRIENADRSISENIINWQPDNITQTNNSILLTGTYITKQLVTELQISVKYTIVHDKLIKKTITLHQPNIPLLFYAVQNSLVPSERPKKCWSFDNADHKGGFVHGTYPAIGFTTSKAAFGILTDAGHRNLWTRNVRRRPSAGGSGFHGILRTLDAKMLEIQKDSASIQFGLVSDYTNCEKTKLSPFPYQKWLPDVGTDYQYDQKAKTATIQGKKGAAINIPYDAPDGFYTISFDYKATAPLNIRVHKERPDSEVQAMHYQTDRPFDPNQYLNITETLFISDTEGLPVLLRVFLDDNQANNKLDIMNLSLVHHRGTDMPYHQLKIGETHSKTIFYFAQDGDTLHDIRLGSQTNLADGLGFIGTVPEKVLYADAMMLCWITGEHDYTPLNVPSINYAPDMYNRDTFWTICGLYDKPLSEGIFKRWGDTQTKDGGIGTIVTPCMGSTEVKGNEAACEWLWLGLINKRRYGSVLPIDKLKLAFDYCVNEFDKDHTGICKSHFILGQNDVTTYPGDLKTSDICVNQGMWAVTLKVAKALGLDVCDQWIEKAVNNYQGFYDPALGYMLNDKKYKNAISFNDLLPEFVSLWLFDEAMLENYMVINTLNKIPREGDFGFIIGHVKNKYFTMDDKPYDGHFTWPDGIYYNGGSWMREEVMGYATGVKHGWEKGKELIERRLLAEITINPDEPISHEYIPTDLSVPNCWVPGTRVFSWNVFALIAKEVALGINLDSGVSQ